MKKQFTEEEIRIINMKKKIYLQESNGNVNLRRHIFVNQTDKDL